MELATSMEGYSIRYGTEREERTQFKQLLSVPHFCCRAVGVNRLPRHCSQIESQSNHCFTRGNVIITSDFFENFLLVCWCYAYAHRLWVWFQMNATSSYLHESSATGWVYCKRYLLFIYCFSDRSDWLSSVSDIEDKQETPTDPRPQCKTQRPSRNGNSLILAQRFVFKKIYESIIWKNFQYDRSNEHSVRRSCCPLEIISVDDLYFKWIAG